jgi:hypothetical protein
MGFAARGAAIFARLSCNSLEHNMEDSLFQTVKMNMQLKTTEELLEIYYAHDGNAWTEQAFKAVEMILIERLGKIPDKIIDSDEIDVKTEAIPENKKKLWRWLRLGVTICIVIVLRFIPFLVGQELHIFDWRYVVIDIVIALLRGLIIGTIIVQWLRLSNVLLLPASKIWMIVGLWGVVFCLSTISTLLYTSWLDSISPHGLLDFLVKAFIDFIRYFTAFIYFGAFSLGGWGMYSLLKRDVTIIKWDKHMIWGLVFGLENFCIKVFSSILIKIIMIYIWVTQVETYNTWTYLGVSTIVSTVLVFTLGRWYLDQYKPVLTDKEIILETEQAE